MKMQSVVVTGASTGIGRACALRLDRLGFGVFAGVRRESDAEQLRQEASNRLRPVMLDVTDEAGIERVAQEVAEVVGECGLWGLVNNAGIPVLGPMEYLPIDELRRQLEVNLVGQVAVTQAFSPLLRQARGRIVNMSSISGRVALPFCGPYAASKFALEAISDSTRLEMRPHGVAVCLIEPGSISTPIWDKITEDVDGMTERFSSQAHEHYGSAIEAASRRMRKSAREAGSVDGVVNAVVHALTARRPRTRYVVGRSAKSTAILKRFLPDRLFDAIISGKMNANGNGNGNARRAQPDKPLAECQGVT